MSCARAHLSCAHASSWSLYASEASRRAHLDHHDLGLDAAQVRALAAELASGSARERVRAAELVARLVLVEPGARWGEVKEELRADVARHLGAATPDGMAKRVLSRAKDALRVALEKENPLRVSSGAYIALSRQGLDYVRHAALRRLVALAGERGEFVDGARAALLAALGDSAAPVRAWAFWVLSGGRGLEDAQEGEPPATLVIDGYALAREAIATGQVDMGERALAIIASLGKPEQGRAALESITRGRDTGLATIAVAQLAAMIGPAAAYRVALSGPSAAIRSRAFTTLLELSDAGGLEARRVIEEAAASAGDLELGREAAIALAARGSSAGYERLVELADGELEAHRVADGVSALLALARRGGVEARARVVSSLLAIARRDPSESASKSAAVRGAIGALSALRDPSAIEGLVAIAERDADAALVDSIIGALFSVSGYDQPLPPSRDDRDEDPLAVERPAGFRFEHEHRPEALAEALALAVSLHRTARLGPLVEAARLVPAPSEPGATIDALLARLCGHPEEGVRLAAIESLSWRARHRGAPLDGLERALGAARGAAESVAAARALARSGRADGMSALLAATEFVDDVGVSARAVEALGALLAIPGALDAAATRRVTERLLAIASDPEHDLREDALAAVGRAGSGPRGPEIVALLRASLRSDDPRQSECALKGLGWVGTREAWDEVRAVAVRPQDRASRVVALEILGDDDSEASRALLRDVLRTTREVSEALAALDSLRRQYGRDSLEPDYALLLANTANSGAPPLAIEVELARAFARLIERGEAERLLSTLAEVRGPSIATTLMAALSAREPIPVAGALAALGSPLDKQVGFAARLLGRAARDAAIGRALAAALEEAARAWAASRAEAERGAAANDLGAKGRTPRGAHLGVRSPRRGHRAHHRARHDPVDAYFGGRTARGARRARGDRGRRGRAGARGVPRRALLARARRRRARARGGRRRARQARRGARGRDRAALRARGLLQDHPRLSGRGGDRRGG